MSQSAYDLIDTALITGGAGGIGRALAENIIKTGKKVIIAGRKESKRQSTAREIGADYYVLDTSKVETIPSFVEKLLKDWPNLNTIINNAGVQRHSRFQAQNSATETIALTSPRQIKKSIRISVARSTW